MRPTGWCRRLIRLGRVARRRNARRPKSALSSATRAMEDEGETPGRLTHPAAGRSPVGRERRHRRCSFLGRWSGALAHPAPRGFGRRPGRTGLRCRPARSDSPRPAHLIGPPIVMGSARSAVGRQPADFGSDRCDNLVSGPEQRSASGACRDGAAPRSGSAAGEPYIGDERPDEGRDDADQDRQPDGDVLSAREHQPAQRANDEPDDDGAENDGEGHLISLVGSNRALCSPWQHGSQLRPRSGVRQKAGAFQKPTCGFAAIPHCSERVMPLAELRCSQFFGRVTARARMDV